MHCSFILIVNFFISRKILSSLEGLGEGVFLDLTFGNVHNIRIKTNFHKFDLNFNKYQRGIPIKEFLCRPGHSVIPRDIAIAPEHSNTKKREVRPYSSNPLIISLESTEYCPNISKKRMELCVCDRESWVAEDSMPVVQSRTRMFSYPIRLMASGL